MNGTVQSQYVMTQELWTWNEDALTEDRNYSECRQISSVKIRLNLAELSCRIVLLHELCFPALPV